MSKPKWNLFIIFLLLFCVVVTQDTLICSNKANFGQNQLTVVLPKLWSQVKLNTINRYEFLILCPIIFILQLLMIILYFKSKNLFVRPGDIFFGNIITSCLLNLHLFTTGIYDAIYSGQQIMPPSFINFCIANSFIQSFATILQVQYLFLFLSYVILVLRTSLNQKPKFLGWHIHLILAIIAIILCIGVWQLNLFGLSSLGLCELTNVRNNNMALGLSLTALILFLLFMVIGMYSWRYFNKHMPKIQGLKRKTYRQIRLISVYIGGFSIFLSLYCISSLTLYFNCFKDGNFLLPVYAVIFNFLRVFEYIYLIVLLFVNRTIRKKFFKMIRQFIQRRFYGGASDIDDLDFYREQSDLQENWFDDRMIQLREQKNKIDIYKIAQILTIISGVKIAHKQYMSNQLKDSSNTINNLKRIYFCQQITFEIGAQILADFQIKTQLLSQFNVLEGIVTLYAPRAFQRIIQNDNLYNIHQSFDLLSNYTKLVSHLVEGEGGRSGQFFFFTSDHKYILKTINQQEYTFITQYLQKFFQYFIKNPSSLITKIYGIYTIKNKSSKVAHHLILMKNLSGCPKKNIIRTYDLKGSQYQRQVLKEDIQYSQSQIRKKVLKDVDFKKIQQTIHISARFSMNLRQILRKDSIFLKSLNLIDYSLLVIKIQYSHFSTEKKINGSNQSRQQISQSEKDYSFDLIKNENSQSQTIKMTELPSVINQDQYYRIGIIDYMQKWDLQKKGQKWWKNLLGKKEVSAQQPGRYQERFMKFVETITTYSIQNYKISSIC